MRTIDPIEKTADVAAQYGLWLHVDAAWGGTADLSVYSQAKLDAVADELNDRPRQTLGWRKPTKVLNKFLVEAGGTLTT